MVNATPRPFYPCERDAISILREAGWTPGPGWVGAEKNFASTGLRSPDRPACSQSLPRLRYPGQSSVLFCSLEFRSVLNIIEKYSQNIYNTEKFWMVYSRVTLLFVFLIVHKLTLLFRNNPLSSSRLSTQHLQAVGTSTARRPHTLRLLGTLFKHTLPNVS